VVLAISAALAGLIAWPAKAPAFQAVRSSYVPSDAWLLDRNGVVLDSKRIRFDVRRLQWVPLRDISPALVTALVAGEDRHFWTHEGVDWGSALGALRDELWHHRRRGASTITMQLATLLERHAGGSSSPSLTRKLRQMRMAFALERSWTKPEILEAYLNLLEYQGEMQGINAASRGLLGKPPSSLSLAESLALAALLPQPDAEADRVTTRACARARAAQVPVQCDEIRSAVTTLFAAHSQINAERLAPQLAQTLLKAPGEYVQTSLDISVQRLAERIVNTHLAALAERNVRDAAALVVDNATGQVLAYVGSGGTASRSPHVDGVRARRQAGSTLKPFLYELALERRYVTAASLLADSPLALDTAGGLYIPQDYDHDFKGLVSVRTALGSSLNVPAVRTLVLVGVEAFRNRLHDLGYAGIKESGEYYGYSLALGSAEVSLWEQAQAYRTLALGGAWSPLRLSVREVTAQTAASAPRRPRASSPQAHASVPQAPESTPQGRRPAPASAALLSRQATFIVSDMLSDPAARAVTFGLSNHLDTGFWTAVKTGTSEDMRDNWCIGYSRYFTVAVWVGNFEGDSMRDVSGVSGAAPIWHDLMTELHRGLTSTAPAPPAGVTSVITHFTPAVEPPRHEWYWSTGPGEATAVNVAPGSGPARIESPADGMIIALDPDIPPPRQRVLISVRGARPSMRLVLNGEPLGTANSQQLWPPRPGSYHLTLEDDTGRPLDTVLFRVRGTN
jgi:penicillin-binding protein 1C